jgi:hypothetical protein
MLFDDRHRFPALQAGAKRELFLYMRRRIQPAPSEGTSLMTAELQIRQDEKKNPVCFALSAKVNFIFQTDFALSAKVNFIFQTDFALSAKVNFIFQTPLGVGSSLRRT